MFNRVLILSMNIGSGHRRAAEALRTAFYRLGAAHEVHTADALQYSPKLFRKLFLGGFLAVVNYVPAVYGWLYDRFNTPTAGPKPRNLFETIHAEPVLRLLDECRPDLVISTHALPAGIISHLRATGRTAAPHAIVVTDFDVHAMWVCDHCEQYLVACDDVRLQLDAFGVSADRIAVTGIPIDPVFAEPQERTAARRELGLDPDRPTLLVTSGGGGLGPVARTVQALRELRTAAQVVVICGTNGSLKSAVDRIARTAGAAVQIVSIGWTARMHTYMAAADLIVGKTGGLTASEALACGLPFVIIKPIQGQETRNAAYLLEEGAALCHNSFRLLARRVDKLLGHPRRLARMQANARRLGRPDAAGAAVRRLMMLGRGPSPARPGTHKELPCMNCS